MFSPPAAAWTRMPRLGALPQPLDQDASALPSLQPLRHPPWDLAALWAGAGWSCGLWLDVRAQVCLETLEASASPSLKREPRQHSG